MKHADSLSAEILIANYKFIFSEYMLSKKIVPDAGTNFVVEKFQTFSAT